MEWYGIQALYSAPQQPWANRGPFGSISSKRQVLRSDEEVERLEEEAQADGGRRFQREGPATKRI